MRQLSALANNWGNSSTRNSLMIIGAMNITPRRVYFAPVSVPLKDIGHAKERDRPTAMQIIQIEVEFQ